MPAFSAKNQLIPSKFCLSCAVNFIFWSLCNSASNSEKKILDLSSCARSFSKSTARRALSSSPRSAKQIACSLWKEKFCGALRNTPSTVPQARSLSPRRNCCTIKSWVAKSGAAEAGIASYKARYSRMRPACQSFCKRKMISRWPACSSNCSFFGGTAPVKSSRRNRSRKTGDEISAGSPCSKRTAAPCDVPRHIFSPRDFTVSISPGVASTLISGKGSVVI